MLKKFFDDIIDKMDVNAESNCFMIIKDYNRKPFNLSENTSHQPSKNKLGRVSKTFLDIINKLFEATNGKHLSFKIW